MFNIHVKYACPTTEDIHTNRIEEQNLINKKFCITSFDIFLKFLYIYVALFNTYINKKNQISIYKINRDI